MVSQALEALLPEPKDAIPAELAGPPPPPDRGLRDGVLLDLSRRASASVVTLFLSANVGL